ncbi:MAG: lysoplasmalogenase [Firmicutes bacterium]|nr:lysoplasmalogenase [Bacillota bacterium]
MAAILFTAFGACTLVPYIFFRCKRKLLTGILLKIPTSAFFLLAACAAALACPAALFGQYKFLFFGVIIGQIFGMMGDFWLDMKDMMPPHHDPLVFAGFISFFIGHCFFVAGLFATYGADLKTWLLTLGTGVVFGVAVALGEKPMKLKYGKFKAVSAAYGGVFGMSLAASLLTYLATKQPQVLVMNIGLLVFLLSDVFLSGTFFGEGKQRPIDYTLNYICYYGGQFTIALSLLLVRGASAFTFTCGGG